MRTEEMRNELAQLRERYEMKVNHFKALNQIAKYTKFDIRDLSERIDALEKKINSDKNKRN